MSTNDIKDAILYAALPNVAFDGWEWSVILSAAEQAGYSDQDARTAFPDQILDVLDHFSDMADRGMMEALQDINPDDMRVRDRVHTALMARYQWLAPHKEAVSVSLKFWVIPTRKPRAAQIVWRTADHIWDWAGDTATDYNRYTKRGLLSAIIVPTTLVWVNDTDPDMRKTRQFLEDRITNVLQIGGAFGKILGKFKGHCG